MVTIRLRAVVVRLDCPAAHDSCLTLVIIDIKLSDARKRAVVLIVTIGDAASLLQLNIATKVSISIPQSILDDRISGIGNVPNASTL